MYVSFLISARANCGTNMNANRRNTASGGRLVQIDAIKANGGHLLLQKPGPADQYIKVQKTVAHLDVESFSFL